MYLCFHVCIIKALILCIAVAFNYGQSDLIYVFTYYFNVKAVDSIGNLGILQIKIKMQKCKEKEKERKIVEPETKSQ